MATLGRKIASARIETGLQQEDLAQALGVTGATVSRYESDIHNPGLEKLRIIAEATGKPLGYFLGEDTAPTELTIGGIAVSGPADKLAEIVRRLQREPSPDANADTPVSGRAADQHTGIHEVLILHRQGRLERETGERLTDEEAAWLSRVNFSARPVDTIARALELVRIRRTWDIQDRLSAR